MILLVFIALLLVLTYALAIAENRRKHKPPAGTGPGEKVIAAARKTAEKERKAADRIQLLNMDIKHYADQYEQLEKIEPKNIKQEIAIEQRKYQVERKIAAAALEMERLQTPD